MRARLLFSIIFLSSSALATPCAEQFREIPGLKVGGDGIALLHEGPRILQRPEAALQGLSKNRRTFELLKLVLQAETNESNRREERERDLSEIEKLIARQNGDSISGDTRGSGLLPMRPFIRFLEEYDLISPVTEILQGLAENYTAPRSSKHYQSDVFIRDLVGFKREMKSHLETPAFVHNMKTFLEMVFYNQTVHHEHWERVDLNRPWMELMNSPPSFSKNQRSLEDLIFRHKERSEEQKSDSDVNRRNAILFSYVISQLQLGRRGGEEAETISAREFSKMKTTLSLMLIEYGEAYRFLQTFGYEKPEITEKLARVSLAAFYRELNQPQSPQSYERLTRAGSLAMDAIDRLPRKKRNKFLNRTLSHLNVLLVGGKKATIQLSDKAQTAVTNVTIYGLLKQVMGEAPRTIVGPSKQPFPVVIIERRKGASNNSSEISLKGQTRATRQLVDLVTSLLKTKQAPILDRGVLYSLLFYLEKNQKTLHDQLVNKGFFQMKLPQKTMAQEISKESKELPRYTEALLGLLDYFFVHRNVEKLKKFRREFGQNASFLEALEKDRNPFIFRVYGLEHLYASEIEVSQKLDHGGDFFELLFLRSGFIRSKEDSAFRHLFRDVETLIHSSSYSRKKMDLGPSSLASSEKANAETVLRDYIINENQDGLSALVHLGTQAGAKGALGFRTQMTLLNREELSGIEVSKEIALQAAYAAYLINTPPPERYEIEMRW